MVDAKVVPLNKRALAPAEREPMLRQVFGLVLRHARLAQGRTLADVAEHAQVSTPYLSEIERGLKEASSEVLAAICRALDLRALDLVARAYAELNGTGSTRAGADRNGPTASLVLRTPFRSHDSPLALAA